MSSLPQPFIVKAQTERLLFIETWNASIGGFQLVAAKARDAIHFHINTTCDGIYCGLDHWSFNRICPESGLTTEYSAWVESGLADGGLVTFFEDAAAAMLTDWFRVIAEWSTYSCRLGFRAWNENDLSAPVVTKEVLFLGFDFNMQVSERSMEETASGY